VERREKMERKSSQEEFEHSLEKKFGKKPDSNT
jgi:hypothetical protein